MSKKVKEQNLIMPEIFAGDHTPLSQVANFVGEVLDYDKKKGKQSFEDLRKFIYQNHAKDGGGTVANFIPAILYVDAMKQSLKKLRKKKKK